MFLIFLKGSDDGLFNSFIQSFSFFIQRTEEENTQGEEEPPALTVSFVGPCCSQEDGYFVTWSNGPEVPDECNGPEVGDEWTLSVPSSHGAMVQKLVMNAHSRLRRHVGQ